MDNVHQQSLRALLEFSFTRYQDKTFLYFIEGAGYTYGEFHAKAYETAPCSPATDSAKETW